MEYTDKSIKRTKRKLSAKGMKALKVVHLVCIIAWFGSAISMNLLRHLVEVEDAAGTFYMGPLVKENVLIGKAIMEGNGDAAQYWHNVSANAYAGLRFGITRQCTRNSSMVSP